jgi:hypothetical protein
MKQNKFKAYKLMADTVKMIYSIILLTCIN